MTTVKERLLRQRILRPPSTMVRRVLLACGILAPLLYVTSDILATLLYEGYSYTDQTISELFAIGAPTRPLILVLAPAYALLVYAFGAGLWASAGAKRALRVVAAGLIGKEVLGLVVTLFFPMHMRGVEGTLTDTMHATLTLVGNLFFLLAIGFGATVFGKRFGLYSIATMVLIAWAAFWRVWTFPKWRRTCRRRGWDSGSAWTPTLTCSGWRCWPSLSYAPEWDGPEMISMGGVLLDKLGPIARHAD